MTLIELRRRTNTDENGTFQFDRLAPGTYLLEAISPRAGNAVRQVTIAAGGELDVDVALDRAVHFDEVVVTVNPEARGLAEAYQPVDVLSGNELAMRREATLGETLRNEPGVTSTYFGPGASRPVIRGLGGDRIRILENGLGTGDASNTSPDHAVASDPLSAERIEIVRGPATLLYGSSAVGGVVNVIDRRIPSYLPGRPVTGLLDVRGGTVANERSGDVALDGALGTLAWHGEYLRRETDDYEIPGFADAHHEEEIGGEQGTPSEELFGILENSAVESEGGSLGLSYVREVGFLGAAWSGFDTFYGVPGHEHHEEGEPAQDALSGDPEESRLAGIAGGNGGGATGEEEEHVSIDLQQRRVDVRGEVSQAFSVFRGVRGRFGSANYEHVELEGDVVGTTFENDYWEGRLDALHRPVGAASGSLGTQISRREFTVTGEEAFLPPTETESWALFAFEELARDPIRVQLGVRYENQNAATDEIERSFDGLSASAGVVWLPATQYSLAVSLTRAVKLPTVEELYSNGPHIATNSFEIGDPELESEKSLGLDVSVRKLAGRLSGQLNFFVNRFDRFIFPELTGEEEAGLQVVQYVQNDAVFTGGEAHADIELFHTEPHHVALELTADYVRAELRETDEPVPRIPPFRTGVGLRYQGEGFWGTAEARFVSEQDRVAPFEEPTEGYTMLNASVGYRFFLGGLVHDVALRGTNLSDEEARNHTSFLKEIAPLPGRDVSLSYRLSF